MSAIFAMLDRRSRPIDPAALGRMADAMAFRGPDGVHTWTAGPVALGYAHLAVRRCPGDAAQPMVHRASGCVVVGDVRIDNRHELHQRLGRPGRPAPIDDIELVLHAYLRYGERCPEHILGDFTFAVWDPHVERLFCARDHLGGRRLHYWAGPGDLVAVATEARSVADVCAPTIRLNEGRVADFLTDVLEGVDLTSTFFVDVEKLAPAHTLTVGRDGRPRPQRYWHLPVREPARGGRDEQHVEQFVEAFRHAVACRIGDVDAPATMLSGGLDSGSIAATAQQLQREHGRPSMRSFSAVSAAGNLDSETRLARASARKIGTEHHEVLVRDVLARWPDLLFRMTTSDEPFDAASSFVWALYLAANEAGSRVLLDGAAGDVVVDAGGALPRLFLRGRWRELYRTAQANQRFFDIDGIPVRHLRGAVTSALAPAARSAVRRRRHPRRVAVVGAQLDPGFARRIGLADRVTTLDGWSAPLPARRVGAQRAQTLRHPFLTVGIERYERTAGRCGIDQRDPFLDLRVIDAVLSLPDHVIERDGWPKMLLRQAMAGRLPDEVLWKKGRDDLGEEFADAIAGAQATDFLAYRDRRLAAIEGYVADQTIRTLRELPDRPARADRWYAATRAMQLAAWLTAPQV